MKVRVAKAAARTIPAQEAAGLVRPGMWIDYGAVLSQPDVFDAALAARKEELSNVKIRACLSTRPRAVLEVDPEGKHFCFLNLHFSGYDRRKHDGGVCGYLPSNPSARYRTTIADSLTRSTSSLSRLALWMLRAGSILVRRADRPAGAGRLRVRRLPSHQWHRRAGAVRARCLRGEGREVVHLPVLHLREARGAAQPYHAVTHSG